MVGVSKNDGVFTNPMQTYPHLEQLLNNMINFTDWSCKGIKYLEHIFEGTNFIPFDKLVKQYGINKHRFLEYQQIKSIVKGKFKSNHIKSNRGGVNGLYLGVLLSFVVWELTEWWGGVVFSSAVGSGGTPRAAMGPGLDGPGPPPWADLG